ncbi:MAG: Holliday junction resolvase RuvX [Acidobacteria bacterium]|nr:Holliday junction resolvase RuvX [Acidobacteriota bacterium]
MGLGRYILFGVRGQSAAAETPLWLRWGIAFALQSAVAQRSAGALQAVFLDAVSVRFIYLVTMKLLAVDYGTKRIGLATCDEFQITTRGLETMLSEGLTRDAVKLAAVAEQTGCGAILVGLPLHLDGTAGRSANRVLALARELRNATHRPVHLMDERLTSREADERLGERAGRRDRQPGRRDQEAARIILEDYLRSVPCADLPK